MLTTRIPEFLKSKGDSIENLDEFIGDSVKSAGLFTNEGVVTAGLALINYLYYNYKVQIPYLSNISCAGTRYNELFGINPEIGRAIPSSILKKHDCKGKYRGFDCASFVGWSIHNGGFVAENTSDSYVSEGDAKEIRLCSKSDPNGGCAQMKPKSEAFAAFGKLVPGDLLQSAGHVIIVLQNDPNNKKMYIYEGTTPVGIDTLTYEKIYTKWKCYKLVQMESYYKKSSNYACIKGGDNNKTVKDSIPESWKNDISKFESSRCN